MSESIYNCVKCKKKFKLIEDIKTKEKDLKAALIIFICNDCDKNLKHNRG